VSRLRDDQGGWTLIELMIGSALMLVILGASLAVFESFVRTTAHNAAQNDAQQSARATTMQVARQLRNLAGPTEGQPQAFDSIGPYNLIFQTVNPTGPAPGQNYSNVQRVRYCLDTGSPGKLWVQTQSWTTLNAPAVPSTVGCPASGWGSQQVAASYIVNNYGGQSRPVFAFNSSDPTMVTEVRTDLYVDPDPAHAPTETHLQSGVFLRNQNRPPLANLQTTPGNQGHVILNASASTDPEGKLLSYSWSDNGTKLKSTSPVWDYQTTSGPHTIQVDVRDPAGLIASASAQVTVP
jgi:type II secretory pathway pseudopilin PulG